MNDAISGIKLLSAAANLAAGLDPAEFLPQASGHGTPQPQQAAASPPADFVTFSTPDHDVPAFANPLPTPSVAPYPEPAAASILLQAQTTPGLHGPGTIQLSSAVLGASQMLASFRAFAATTNAAPDPHLAAMLSPNAADTTLLARARVATLPDVLAPSQPATSSAVNSPKETAKLAEVLARTLPSGPTELPDTTAETFRPARILVLGAVLTLLLLLLMYVFH